MLNAALNTIKLMFQNRRIINTTAQLELKKRYAGSLLGFTWVVLYPVLFLCVYLFLYLIVFKVKYPNLNTLESIIYIFSGLIPYIAFMEAVNGSAVALKQNIHIIKNVILPVELIPIRAVSVALFTQCVGLCMILILCAFNGSIATTHLFILPIAIIIQTLFLLGLAFLVAPIGIALPDTAYFMNLLTLLLLFLSPIGFMSTMLPHRFQLIIDINPVYYMLEPFRETFLTNNSVNFHLLAGSLFGAIIFFVLGCTFFHKFKNFIAEYE